MHDQETTAGISRRSALIALGSTGVASTGTALLGGTAAAAAPASCPCRWAGRKASGRRRSKVCT